MMLTVRPKSWIGWTYVIQDAARQTVGEVSCGFLSNRGAIRLGADTYAVRPEGFVRGPFRLEGPSGVLARGRKRPLRAAFDIEVGEKRYLLRRTSWLSAEWVLLEGSLRVGSLLRPLLTRRATLEVAAAVPLPVQLLVLWLTVWAWSRQSGS